MENFLDLIAKYMDHMTLRVLSFSESTFHSFKSRSVSNGIGKIYHFARRPAPVQHRHCGVAEAAVALWRTPQVAATSNARGARKHSEILIKT